MNIYQKFADAIIASQVIEKEREVGCTDEEIDYLACMRSYGFQTMVNLHPHLFTHDLTSTYKVFLVNISTNRTPDNCFTYKEEKWAVAKICTTDEKYVQYFSIYTENKINPEN